MTTLTYNYTGSAQTFTWATDAPGATTVAADIKGAGVNTGAKGGQVTGTITKSGESTLQINVGGIVGTFNGGAAGGTGGGGSGEHGADASDIRQGGTGTANRVAVGGGAGGSGGDGGLGTLSGGAGGASTGATGTGDIAASGGAGGTQLAAGAGGTGHSGADGTAGSGANGGVGGNATGASGAGGGGGGGYFGAGGGEAGNTGTSGAGGGGGSNYVGGMTSTASNQGVRSGNGVVTLTFSTAPLAPTLGTITPGNAQLSAAFTAGGDGGSAITSYKYSTDNGATYRTRQTGTTASPIVITTLSSDGTTPLVNGTPYTVIIKAVNANGDGAASNAVTATPATTPSAPTALVATGGNAQVSVAFTAGATGGSAITSYKYSTDNGSTFRTRQTGTTASPVVITTLSSDGTTPLVNGNTYQIQLKAVNAIGDGTASAAVSGTPVAPVATNLDAAFTMRVGGL